LRDLVRRDRTAGASERAGRDSPGRYRRARLPRRGRVRVPRLGLVPKPASTGRTAAPQPLVAASITRPSGTGTPRTTAVAEPTAARLCPERRTDRQPARLHDPAS